MSIIRFQVKLFQLGSWTLLHLPKNASAKLPSRGIAMVQGTINDFPFQAVLEPDGKGSHWFRLTETICKAAHAYAGDTVVVAIEPSKEWLEVEVPSDLKKALISQPDAHETWLATSLIARWDWVRWIASTQSPETRKERIKNACQMLKSGKKRPCCFNRSLCCEPYVSKKGVLLSDDFV